MRRVVRHPLSGFCSPLLGESPALWLEWPGVISAPPTAGVTSQRGGPAVADASGPPIEYSYLTERTPGYASFWRYLSFCHRRPRGHRGAVIPLLLWWRESGAGGDSSPTPDCSPLSARQSIPAPSQSSEIMCELWFTVILVLWIATLLLYFRHLVQLMAPALALLVATCLHKVNALL